MKETPLAYIPTDRLRALARGAALPERSRGAALFADISGFTLLTEALAQELGPQRGAEELAHHLNTVYDALIGEVHRYDGSVLSFSGDAITCWFDGNEGSLNAVTAGHAMQAAMRRFSEVVLPSGQTQPLVLKVTVTSGIARRFVVGDPDIQCMDALAGELMERLASGEHHARGGEVVMDEATVDTLKERAHDCITIVEWRSDEHTPRSLIEGISHRFAVLAQLLASALPKKAIDSGALTIDDQETRKWLLHAVYQRLCEGRGEFLAELRPAVALFLRFGGIDYENDERAGEKLDAYIREIQRVVMQMDGNLMQLNIGDKGSYVYIAFGAPQAHEDDVVRACSAALSIRELSKSVQYIQQVHIGISQGRMRAGAFGASTRRTYSVQGDDTNLAARLMQLAAPGQILVSKWAQQSAADAFIWEELPPMQVKGKREPVPVCALMTPRARKQLWQSASRYVIPMVGREAELKLLAEKLDRVLEGHGQIIAITGEAGIGKTRLMSEVIDLARDRSMIGYDGECESYGTSDSYLCWESVWRGIFGLNAEWPTDTQIREVEAHLSRVSPWLAMRSPLLAPLLNLPIPDNDLTRAFDAKLRKTSLESLLMDCLRDAAQRQPMLILLEDCHWLDPLSQDLLEVAARAIADLPVMLLLAMRPPELEWLQKPRYVRLPHYSEIPLKSFTLEEAQWLIELKLQHIVDVNLSGGVGVGEQGAPNPASLGFVQRIIERAEGNPFYIEELLGYLRDRGISVRDTAALEKLELPASLHSLILARIDRLADNEKDTLRVASVIGRLFKASVLWEAYPQLGDPQRIGEALQVLSERELTLVDSELELTYLFKHVLTHEATYESLPFATRAMLHEQVAKHFERVYSSMIDQQIDLIAYHYGRSPNTDKQRIYLLRAGEVAQETYANAAAIDYFQRVLPLLTPAEQVKIQRKLGQVLELVGNWDGARQSYEQAMALAHQLGDRAAEARCRTAMGELLRKRGQFGTAEEWLLRARGAFEALEDEAGVGQVLHYAGSMAAQQGRHDQARDLYERSLAIRRKLGDKPNTANLLSNLGIVARLRGDLALARNLHEESLAIRRKSGDHRAIAVSLNNLALVALDQDDHAEARVRLEEAVALQREVGDKAYLANALNNLGNAVRAQGDFHAAREHYRAGLQLSRELGDLWAIAYLLEDISVLCGLEGDPQLMFQLIGAATTLRDTIGAPLSPAERKRLEQHLAAAGKEFSVDQVKAWQSAGAAMSLEAVVDDAMQV